MLSATLPSDTPTVAPAVTDVVVADGPKKRVNKRRVINNIPDDLINDPEINAAIQALPTNYNFEIHKSIWRVRSSEAKCVALQFPEGLLLYACVIADLLQKVLRC